MKILRTPATAIALGYLILGSLWIVASDFLLELVLGGEQSGRIPQTIKGLGFVALSALLLYWLMRRRSRHGDERRAVTIEAPRPWLPLAIFGVFAAGLIAIGYVTFDTQRQQLIDNTHEKIRAVGELRVEQINAWLLGVRGNALHFSRNTRLVEDFAAWLDSGAPDDTAKQRLLEQLSEIRARFGYGNISLFDRQGMVSLSERDDPHMAEHADEARLAMRESRSLLVDYHLHGGPGAEPMLGMMVPMISGYGQRARTLGALFFAIPARTSMVPLIERWPSPSPSGETLLTRREGADIRVLYASRDTRHAGLGPLVQSEAARWLNKHLPQRQQSFIPDAVDFRGAPVLAYASLVPNTPWILITKQVRAEIDAQVDWLAKIAALVVSLLLLAAGMASWLWWRGQINRQRAQLLGKELERQILEQRFAILSRFASDVILLTDEQGRIIECNERIETLYGYTREEVIGQHTRVLLPPEPRGALLPPPASAGDDARLNFETEHQRKDGSRFPVEVSAHVIELQGLHHGHLTLRDISERVRNEARLRMQAMVLDQIQDQVTITDLNGIVTYVNEAQAQAIGKPVEALFGHSVEIFGDDPDADASQREIVHATQRDGEWHGRLINHASSDRRMVVELRTRLVRDERSQPQYLVGIGTDITERLRAEQALREREARYRRVIETSVDGFWIIDTSARILEVNDAYCQRSGYRREELLDMRIGDLDAAEDPARTAAHIAEIMHSGNALFETLHRARDGTFWQVEVNASYSPEDGGRLFVFLRDVQLRNRSEALLRTRLLLSEIALDSDLDTFMQAALDKVEQFTASRIGFFHFVDADQETLTLQAWSNNTLNNMCTAEGKGQHYPISQAGVWVDAVVERKALIHNDYASLPHKKGMPEGHAPVIREMVVPILRGDQVIAVLGVGNKASDYNEADVEVAMQLSDMVMDLFARKRAEEQFRLSNARLLEAQRIARLGNWEMDAQTHHVLWSPEVFAMMGLDSPSNSRDAPPLEQIIRRFDEDDRAILEQAIARALADGTPYQHEMRVVWPNNEIRHIWVNGQAEKNAEGRVVKLYGTAQDITERRRDEARLEQATHYDALTGLPNAHSLHQRIQQAISDSEIKGSEQKLALLVLNIDRFAQLNEGLGRLAGDQVLIALARRWTANLPEQCLLTRLGADQFAVVQYDYYEAKQVIESAAHLLDQLREPIVLEAVATPVILTASIGVALFPGDARDAAGLLHAAEDALRSAKADRGNQMRFFDRRHAQTAIDWFETENALRQAIEANEFFLLYQPQVDVGNGRVGAVEALIRWRHDGQVVPPGRFIQIVENTDLARPISRWVLHTACQQARFWLDRHRPLRVAVNIFSDHVTSGHLLDDVRDALAHTGLPAHWLELEVVESSLLKNPEEAARALREVKRLGVGLALDDFGTGYSSLGYLKHYPFDVLKIDQMFVRNVNRIPEDAAIVRSTIALAHNLGMRVLAEGVETESQLRFMARYGCDQIQGYLLSRPAQAQEVEIMVMERRDLRPGLVVQEHETKGILVVEDNAGEAEHLHTLLRANGYRVQTCARLEAALDIMARSRIDLILCEYALQGENGLALLIRMRQLFPDIPRIMLARGDDLAVAINAINHAGVGAFLPKPLQPEALLEAMRDLLLEADKKAAPK